VKILAASLGICLLSIIASACSSQAPYIASTYQRTVTTVVEIDTDVPSQVWVADRNIGTTPISFPFSYQEDVNNVVRTANYWETNPGTAAALSVLSFGFYVPFSLIPAEPTTETRPTQKYVGNKLTLRLIAEGHEPLDHVFECTGEPKIVLRLSLARKEREKK